MEAPVAASPAATVAPPMPEPTMTMSGDGAMLIPGDAYAAPSPLRDDVPTVHGMYLPVVWHFHPDTSWLQKARRLSGRNAPSSLTVEPVPDESSPMRLGTRLFEPYSAKSYGADTGRAFGATSPALPETVSASPARDACTMRPAQFASARRYAGRFRRQVRPRQGRIRHRDAFQDAV